MNKSQLNHNTSFDVLVYHDHCTDGLASVAIAGYSNRDAVQIPGNYGTDFDISAFIDKDVCFLDFSTKEKEMLAILDVAKSVTVIDHHVTMIEELDHIVHDKLTIYYDINQSGAQLAWEFFNKKPEPLFISFIGDRDLWTKKFEDSDVLSLAMRVLEWGYEDMSNHIDFIIKGEYDGMDYQTYDLIKQGRVFDVYHQYMVNQIAQNAYSYRLDDDSDTEVLRVNCPMGLMSDVGAVVAKRSPSGVAWLVYETEEFTKHSLRVSEDSEYNAAEFAATKGGGGHVKAAGWQVSHYSSTTLKEAINENSAPVIDGSTSDGYHTFDELYEHRMVLFSIICNQNKDEGWKSLLHSDGTMFDDYFIVGIKTPLGQYTYHYHMDNWDTFNVKELEKAPEWDGHKPSDITRLYSLLKKPVKSIPTNPLT